MIKFGVIGTGWIAEEFVKGAQIVKGFDFTAVYSRKAETGKAFADKFGGAKVYDDLNGFAQSEIDAVYIASPNSLHYAQSRLMLENGKHVLCEKPITVTPEEFAELRAFADSRNLIYTEAIMYLHLPERHILKNAVNEIGKITSAHFDFSQLSSKYAAFSRGELPNIFNPKFATGCLMDLGIYCIYPALELFGSPEKISASSGFMSSGADGYGTAIFDYDDKQVTLTYSKLGQDRLGSQIFGDKGTIVLPSVSKLTDMAVYDNEGNKKALSGDTEKHVLMSYEAEDFKEYISGRKTGEYNYANDLIYSVSKTMQEIRFLSSIRFDL